jgi:predicted Rossmann fold nucleotide-binding protein DprA/Smf involved in DNA uptake
MRTTEAIVDSIEDRLRELNQEIESLTAARTALDGREGGQATSAPPARRKSRARHARRATRPVEVVPAGRLEVLLSENGGLTTSALAERTNGNRDQVLTLLRELESAGRIRRSGQRRSTRWHAISDEDRIRERAAELASRSRRRKS